MRNLLLGTAVAGAASALGVLAGERKLIQRMEATPAPEGWRTPRFPGKTELMVPTDDGAELVVASAGPSDGPVVVLVHGLTSNHHDWGFVADHLVGSGHHVVAMNQRGHGGSTVGTEGFGPERQGRDVGQVLSALDLSDVVLCGHSMGGIAALSLMALVPEAGAERIRGLALIATLASMSTPDRQAGIHFGNTPQYERLARHPRHSRVFARYVFGDMPSSEMVDAALASNARCPRESRAGAALGLLGYDVREHLADIATPAVVVCGDKDLLTPLSENKAIAEALDAQLIVAEGAGHLVIWERSGLVADAAASLTARPANSSV